MKLLVARALLLVSVVAAVGASEPQCRVCDQPIPGEFYSVKDQARGGKFAVCTRCFQLETRCFSCSLPVQTGYTTLADGRTLCRYCASDAITDEEKALRVCWETRDALDRLYARFLTFPQTNLSLCIVDRFTLDALFKSPGYAQPCTTVFGATRTVTLSGGRVIHSVNLLSGLRPAQLEAVAAHEFAHAWLNENLTPARRATLSREAQEGFCELIAYELMQERARPVEQEHIRENPYTEGQLGAFLAAENLHGFGTVLDWVKAGESGKLDPADPDGVRAVRATESPSAAANPRSADGGVPVYYSYGDPPPLPDKLRLKQLSGLPARRLAIINDRTFDLNDRATIKLAASNVVIRCLEIRTNSVLIQFEGTGTRQELFLPEP